ncbi:MAG: NAD-dependent epimerase/dehydratase family protein [Myxococcota bacterium]
MLENATILVTGPASQVGFPIARALAKHNRVIGLARFGREKDRERLEAAGVECVRADLEDDDLSGAPSDVDYVLHFAVVKRGAGDFDADLSANAEGVGRLMAHCRGARAFLHCSSTAVYEYAGQAPRCEGDPLGDNHRVMMPTYSLCKIAAEAVARFACRQWKLPTTIARLSVPYGDNGGWPAFHLEMMRSGVPIPVHPDAPSLFNPIHEDDLVRMLPRLLERASVPAAIVNWAGSEPVSIEEWCAYLGELTGLEPRFETTPRTIGSVVADTARMHEWIGPTEVGWRDGLRRMLESRHPELLR